MTRRLVPFLSLLSLLPLLLLAVGCPAPAGPANFDPEGNSGENSRSSGADPIELGKPTIDRVAYDTQDRTDWKKIELKRTGVLLIDLRWNNARAELLVDAFDSMGQQIATSPPATEPHKIVPVQIDSTGVYFVRVQAAKHGDVSDFTLLARWSDEGEPLAEQHPTATVDAAVVVAPHDAGVPVEHTDEEPPPDMRAATSYDEVQGIIISAGREGSATTLHLDKGSAAGVRVGTKGEVLEGPSGDTALHGGSFKVTQVVDEHRSVATTSLKSVGKNRRVKLFIDN